MANSILDYSLTEIARILGGKVHGSGNRHYIQAPAPGHSANDKSFTLEIGKDHPDDFVVKSHCGDDELKIKDYVREKVSLPAFLKANGKHRPAKKLRATVPPIQTPKPIPESIDGMTPDERLEAAMSGLSSSALSPEYGTPVASYEYKDADGILRYRVERHKPKKFIQCRPSEGGGMIYDLDGVERLPYHLDEIAKYPDAQIFILEGERDTDRVRAEFSVCATTASGGAKWSKLAKYFKGRAVFIVPDHDAEGQKKARQAATALHKIAASIHIVTLPGLSGAKGDKDVSDWLDADKTRASDFIDLCMNSPLWPLEGITLEDFHAYMPMHQYLFVPAGQCWPAASVNSQFDAIEEGDKLISPSQWLDTHRAATQMTWAPGLPLEIPDKIINEGGWLDCKGALCLNLYKPATIRLGDATKADQWIDHIHKVYPDEADHIINFLAHRVQRPHDKINHALFLGGSPGIGKDTLLEPAKLAIGPWNFQDVSPKTMLGQFNGFAKCVILRVSEARDLGDINRYSFYDSTKTYIASPPDVMRVNEKNLKEHYIVNACAVIMTSNYKTDGLYLPADDRRHYVAWSDLTVADFAAGYWNALWGWYGNGGMENVAAYLSGLDISNFDSKAPPPKTPAFWAIVDANQAPEESELADILDKLGWPDATTINELALETSNADFATWLRDRKNRRAIPHRLERCGYIPVRNDTANSGLWVIRGIRQVVYAKAELTLRDRFVAAKELCR